MSYVVVLTTTPNLKEARKIASSLLQKKLAACISILASPVESHYVWKKKKECSREYLLYIKSRKALYRRIQKTILAQHSYAVPEIIALPILKGSKAYLHWIQDSTDS